MNSGDPRASSRVLRLTVSSDGYVRLNMAALRSLSLAHVLSELDADVILPSSTPAGASAASITGLTEWASATAPAVSLGWDWRLVTAAGRPRYERAGEIRSNAMLLDERGRDLGVVGTQVLLCVAVDALPWQEVVSNYITNRYACHLSNLTVTENRFKP